MRNRLNKIFIGLLFLLVNININGIDIIPDLIGLGIIIINLSSLVYLEDESKYFTKAKSGAIALLLLNLISMITFLQGEEFTINYPLLSLGFMVSNIIIMMMFYYNLIKGIVSYIVTDSEAELNKKFKKILDVFLIVGAVEISLVSFAFNFDYIAGVSNMIVMLMVGYTTAIIYFLRLMYKLGDYCLDL